MPDADYDPGYPYPHVISHPMQSYPVLYSLTTEAAFLAIFTTIVLATTSQATAKRTIGVAILATTTYSTERLIVPLCQRSNRPHWAATIASLLWVQFLSASELVLVSRLHAAQLPIPTHGSKNNSASLLAHSRSAIGLLWNMRRVGTQWQAKNVPSTKTQQPTSPFNFIIQRLVTTLLAYLFVDIVVSLPPPPPALLTVEKAALFRGVGGLDVTDIIFRITMTASFWLITAVLNLFITNTGAILSVLLGLCQPEDCPPLHGSFVEAFTVRRFWGISWHQMFRVFLTGHADLLVDPVLTRRSLISRYCRLLLAFIISGLIHYRADVHMGVSESGAMVFFTLHAAGIVVEDAVGSFLDKILPLSGQGQLRRAVGYLWVCVFFVWTTPVYMYPANRLGLEAAALLPVRVFGPLMERSLLEV